MSGVEDLARAAARLADGVSPPASAVAALGDLCRTARLALGAAAVSVSRVVIGRGDEADGLRYEAADGEGAEQIVGVRLDAGRGIAGFVAATGQALSVDHVADDPRFARQVAEATGYVPSALLVVPITAGADPIGVLSVLDRAATTDAVDPLELAGAFARLAAPLVSELDRVSRHGALLVRAMADAIAAGGGPADAAGALAAALRAEAASDETSEAELGRQVALLAELVRRPPEVRARAERVLEELLALTEPRRRR